MFVEGIQFAVRIVGCGTWGACNSFYLNTIRSYRLHFLKILIRLIIMSLHAVVRWKDNDSSAVFGLIPVSCFVQIRGELKAGQTVHALFNGKIRRAEILLLSGNFMNIILYI